MIVRILYLQWVGGVVWKLALCCYICKVIFFYRVLIRPHPAIWRLVHGMAVVYLVVLTFLLFQVGSTLLLVCKMNLFFLCVHIDMYELNLWGYSSWKLIFYALFFHLCVCIHFPQFMHTLKIPQLMNHLINWGVYWTNFSFAYFLFLFHLLIPHLIVDGTIVWNSNEWSLILSF